MRVTRLLIEIAAMIKTLTNQITLAGLRQQAERLGIPCFATMRKLELIKAISEALSK